MRKPMYLVMVIAVLITTATASSDPFIGKWILEPQQSKYPAGECPKHMVSYRNRIDESGHSIPFRRRLREWRYHSLTVHRRVQRQAGVGVGYSRDAATSVPKTTRLAYCSCFLFQVLRSCRHEP
jgi:hypothetical protein